MSRTMAFHLSGLVAVFLLTIAGSRFSDCTEEIETKIGVKTLLEKGDYDVRILHFIRRILRDQEIPERMKLLYMQVLSDVIDADRTGFLESQEIDDWIQTQDLSAKRKASEELFTKYDEDEDSLISWSEYIKNQFQRMRIRANPVNSLNKKVMANQKEMFKAADFNADSFLTHEEFFASIFPSEVGRMKPVFISHLRSSGLEDSLAIDDVFTAAMQVTPDKFKWNELRTEFHNVDADLNQFLTGSELKAWGRVKKAKDGFVVGTSKIATAFNILAGLYNLYYQNQMDLSIGLLDKFVEIRKMVEPEDMVASDEDYEILYKETFGKSI